MSGIVGNNTNRSSGLVKSAAVGADAIDGSNIADDAIDSEHYADVSIDAAHIASNAVTTAKINADAVTGAKIADDAIDSEHYTDGSIDTAHLAADAVTGAKLADNAIDSEHYTDGSIDSEHLATNVILNDVLLKDYGEVTNALGDLGGGTDAINLTVGNSVSATVSTGTQTFTFTNPTASDEGCGFTLVLTNGGSQTVNWPASVDWPAATAPTLTTSGVDILTFWTVDGGTIWHGMAASTGSG
jgi:hypothetical protein